jgi:hypothetical protein
MMPDGHSHPPRVRPATVPLCLKLGLCLCIKPAKSVSRICESASSRQPSSTLPCYRRACFRQAVLCCPYIPTRRLRSLRLRCFEPAKRAPLGASAHLPQSDTLDILGGIESALTGAYILSLVLRPALLSTAISTLFPPTNWPVFTVSGFWRARFVKRPLATQCNSFIQTTTATSLALAPVKIHPRARQIAHDQHSLLTFFAFCTAICNLYRAHCFSSSRFDSLQHIGSCSDLVCPALT